MELKLTQSSLPTAIFNSSSFFPKHFSTLAQKWKLDIQRISWKVQDLTSKKILVHVVKVGETLTSISKLYGVPILEIAAANKETPDVDLVFQGQHLNIPSVAVNPQLCHFEGNKLNEHQSPNESPNWVFHGKQWSQIFTVPLSHRLPLAKTTGSLLLLVPLFVFCIGCIMGAFRNRNLKQKKSKLHHHKSNGVRWRTALSDLRDPESLDAESEPDSDPLSDDLERLQFEDTSHGYNKLEGEYQKFLSECGMSNWGYWRGGSPH
ncbi:hypothetical protein ACS0TY_027951 [Phlomoides rotata]